MLFWSGMTHLAHKRVHVLNAHWCHVVLTLYSPFPSLAGMRILVTLLLDTLPMLGNVLLLCFFVFFIFGIVGVQLWVGRLRNRCFVEDTFPLYVPVLFFWFSIFVFGQSLFFIE